MHTVFNTFQDRTRNWTHSSNCSPSFRKEMGHGPHKQDRRDCFLYDLFSETFFPPLSAELFQDITSSQHTLLSQSKPYLISLPLYCGSKVQVDLLTFSSSVLQINAKCIIMFIVSFSSVTFLKSSSMFEQRVDLDDSIQTQMPAFTIFHI